MRAIVITRAGGPEVLEIRRRPTPSAGAGEVLVRVRATALNRADVLQRLGRYPAPAGVPADVPGLEFAGEVETVGSGVTTWRPGDRVMGIVGGGAYADRLVAPADTCLPVPERMDWTEAAAVPEAFFTAFDALWLRAGVRPSEAVLVHAASSGVGTAAVQLASAGGARVVALSRDAAKRDRLARLCPDAAVLDAGREDLAPAIVAASRGGVDVVVDLVGAAAFRLNVEVLRPLGRWVLVGTMSGSRVEVDLGALLRGRLTLVGTVLRTRPPEEKAALVAAFRDAATEWLASGRIVPVVDDVLPLDRAAEAHRRMESNRQFGKIVLEVGNDRD